jgi:hypothetical protein
MAVFVRKISRKGEKASKAESCNIQDRKITQYFSQIAIKIGKVKRSLITKVLTLSMQGIALL